MDEITVAQPQNSLVAGTNSIPTVFVEAGERASYRFIEFFTAQIRNPNTRQAYHRAVTRYFDWAADRGLQLEQITPVHLGLYIEQLGAELSIPTVKQHLSAISILYDHLVTGHIVPINPANSVKAPKYSVSQGKTPVLSAEKTRKLLDSINTSTIAGLRDRALIGLMVYSFARVGAVVAMKVDDYFPKDKRWWIRLMEKGSKYHEMPLHHKAEKYLDEYIEAASIADKKKSPLFRALSRKRTLTERGLDRRNCWEMVKRRARNAGLPDTITNHTFRGTGNHRLSGEWGQSGGCTANGKSC